MGVGILRLDNILPACGLPSGELTQQWKITILNGKIHYKWPFSIAMLVHQRVKVGYRGKMTHTDSALSTIWW